MIKIHEEDESHVWDELIEKLPWVGDLDMVRQRVLLNIAYHLGVPGLLKFRNTLEFVKNGKYQEAADEISESLWARNTYRAAQLSQAMRSGSGL